jgi:hypothetical protein
MLSMIEVGRHRHQHRALGDCRPRSLPLWWSGARARAGDAARRPLRGVAHSRRREVCARAGIAPPFLCPPLFLQGGLCLGRSWVGRLAHLAASADAAPFAHETPLPEQVGLHVEPVEPAHAPGRINTVEGRRSCPEPRNRGHTDVVRAGEDFQRRALCPALAGFLLLLRGEGRGTAHMLSACPGAAPALRRAGADKIALHVCQSSKADWPPSPNCNAQNLLRQRMAPLGVTHTCGGTCTGGGCEEHQPGGASSAVYHGFVTSLNLS